VTSYFPTGSAPNEYAPCASVVDLNSAPSAESIASTSVSVTGAPAPLRTRPCSAPRWSAIFICAGAAGFSCADAVAAAHTSASTPPTQLHQPFRPRIIVPTSIEVMRHDLGRDLRRNAVTGFLKIS